MAAATSSSIVSSKVHLSGTMIEQTARMGVQAMLKLLDFPFRPFDAEASIRVLAAPYLFWPAQADDGADVSVYVRLSALDEVLGIVGDRPDRDPRDILRESLLKHRRRIEEPPTDFTRQALRTRSSSSRATFVNAGEPLSGQFDRLADRSSHSSAGLQLPSISGLLTIRRVSVGRFVRTVLSAEGSDLGPNERYLRQSRRRNCP
jgi:hypothetical protein